MLDGVSLFVFITHLHCTQPSLSLYILTNTFDHIHLLTGASGIQGREAARVAAAAAAASRVEQNAANAAAVPPGANAPAAVPPVANAPAVPHLDIHNGTFDQRREALHARFTQARAFRAATSRNRGVELADVPWRMCLHQKCHCQLATVERS